MRVRHPGLSKRIFLDGHRYFEVPLAKPPDSVPEHVWNRLSAINDFIIDRVAYDTARAASLALSGVQRPEETLRRGRGICMDIAALFEELARNEGLTVRSITSAKLNHAWNSVEIGNRWWIVDVTWNSGARTDAGLLPSSVTNDSDFRKRYLLTTVARERELALRGLLASTHETSDATEISFARTLEATDLAKRIDTCIAERADAVAAHRKAVEERAALADDLSVVQAHLASPTHAASRSLNIAKERVIRERLGDATARADQLKSAAGDLAFTIDGLVARLRHLAEAHPLGINFEYTFY